MFEELIVVKKKYLATLEAKTRFWVLGWVLCGLMAMAMVAMYYQTGVLIDRVAAIEAEQGQQLELQASTARALLAGWDQAKKTQQALVDWSWYASEKVNVINYNQDNRPAACKKGLNKGLHR